MKRQAPRTARVVAITGGSSGIGRAIALHFHRLGDRVAICSRSAKSASFPKGVLQVDCDVRKKSQVESFVRATKKKFGSIDVFINCAGVSKWRPVEKIDETFAREIIETSLLGTLWGSSAVVPHLSKGGSIVNVSSLAGKRGSANNSAYCAAKFGVNGITQALAKELGPRGIRVNAVCPVFVETDHILESLTDPDSPTGGKSIKAFLAKFASEQTALKRLPTADEVARAVGFLASSDASGITGQCINVDCGTLPQ